MVSRTFTIRNQAGLHLKPSAALCTEAIKYKSFVTLTFGNTTTNAKSVLNVLSACVKCEDRKIDRSRIGRTVKRSQHKKMWKEV